MRIKNVRINGMENPTGFDFGTVCVSWKVREASGKEQQNVKIEVSLTESFEEVLCHSIKLRSRFIRKALSTSLPKAVVSRTWAPQSSRTM